MLTFLLGFLLAAALLEGLLLWKLPREKTREPTGETAVDEGFENIMRFTVGGDGDA